MTLLAVAVAHSFLGLCKSRSTRRFGFRRVDLQHLFSALAQFERRLIQERTKAGLAAARARGRNGERPKIDVTDARVVMAKKLHADKSWRQAPGQPWRTRVFSRNFDVG
ncbi:MAG: recombinase family protein [Planctomycetota bacterium]